jgi:hypothetical protein
LSELAITKSEASRAQRIASIPKEELQEHSPIDPCAMKLRRIVLVPEVAEVVTIR